MGISGRIAKSFLTSEITPLLALVGFLLGVFAVLVTPREEEPQINVTFANVFIAYPGATVKEVEQLVSTPAEQILSEIGGLKHVYSVSKPGMSILTVQFKVGEDRTQAIVGLYNAVYSKQDWLPANLGVSQPLIKPKGIDDVPIVSVTLWSQNKHKTGAKLKQVAHAIEAELKRVPGTRDIYTLGGAAEIVEVAFNPQALAAYKLSLSDIRQALLLSNATQSSGAVLNNNIEIVVQAGEFLSNVDEVRQLVVGVHSGKPVYLQDVANVRQGPEQAASYTWHAHKGMSQPQAAVTIAIAKQPGTNAVDIADSVIKRLDELKGVYIPDDVEVTVTRNYGETADAKAKKLITKLAFATLSVVLLVFFALGRREAAIVGLAVVITLAITLFGSWAWGFTLNRVSLFALIFSIGILVDDAIVVVENIHRHMLLSKDKLVEFIPKAVDEVGGPTILATFTVIAALLPMAFVSGLMGPYMSPIPINASIGMLISLVVAFVVTPWLSNKLLVRVDHSSDNNTRLLGFFQRTVGPFLDADKGKSNRRMLGLTMLVLIVLSAGLVVANLVVLKMLPFDNKSEFQVVVDMPEGTPLEQTNRVLLALGDHLGSVPEVKDYQIYSGGAAPINFNGLVRQYYLRSAANMGDIQVNLVGKSERDRTSHEVASSVRKTLQDIGQPFSANVKIVEVPPGPPVQSPLVAEIYGLDYSGQIETAAQLRKVFTATESIVDVDDSIESTLVKYILKVDQQKTALWGVSELDVVQAIATALNGEDISYLHIDNAKYPVPVRLQLGNANKAFIESVLSVKVRSRDNQVIALADLVKVEKNRRQQTIYHKDLLPVVYVTADVSGKLDSPLYGLFGIAAQADVPQHYIATPENPYEYSVKWDGEWQVTYETFRDMGIAYSVGLLLIYLLVVAQFKSYAVPLIIMAPIPLTIIGVMPGHALLGAQFTATSMIGMIALAGIIVRNSILLVDFINQQIDEGIGLAEAVINAGAVRAKPIVLTGLAAMMGAFFILDDPIFNGLAISLIFGILVSTVLTLLVIPVMYFAYMTRKIS